MRNAFYNEISAKIIDGLETLYGKYTSSSQRWIWELIQNAKDSSADSAPVKIEIIINKDSLEFKHSGKPFTYENLISLVHQTSIKKRYDDNAKEGDIPPTTGKFGTGFISTHLLSRVVEIQGVFY